MNQQTRNNIVVRSVLSIVVGALLFASLAGCKSSSSEEGFHARLVVQSSDANTRPVAFADFAENGDQVVFSSTSAEIQVRRGDVTVWSKLIAANHARVRLKDHGIDWTGLPGQPMPAEARSWFTDEEILAWDLHFDDEITTSTLTSNQRIAAKEAAAACGAAPAALCSRAT